MCGAQKQETSGVNKPCNPAYLLNSNDNDKVDMCGAQIEAFGRRKGV